MLLRQIHRIVDEILRGIQSVIIITIIIMLRVFKNVVWDEEFRSNAGLRNETILI